MIMAGNKCMRPIAMTIVAAILALMPMALGIGAGSDMLQSLAIAIVSEIIAQTLLVLIVLPGFLILFAPVKEKNRSLNLTKNLLY